MIEELALLGQRLRELADATEATKGEMTLPGIDITAAASKEAKNDAAWGNPATFETPVQFELAHLELLFHAANDHLRSLGTLLSGDHISRFRHIGVARAVVETSSRLWYLAEPSIGALERVRRHLRRVEWVAVPYASEWSSRAVRLALTYTRRLRSGPLFRGIDRHGKVNGRLNPDTVSRTLKPYIAELLQTDSSHYSGQSLRAGFITEARSNRIDDILIAQHTRHTLPGHRRGSTLDIYDRPTQLFERSAFTGWY